MNGEIFVSYVRAMPGSRPLNHGDIVVMDNLRAHKAAGVEQAIEAVGAEVAISAEYSPDLNPIEMSFSKLKAYLRKLPSGRSAAFAAELASSCLASAQTKCANYSRSCRICFNMSGIGF